LIPWIKSSFLSRSRSIYPNLLGDLLRARNHKPLSFPLLPEQSSLPDAMIHVSRRLARLLLYLLIVPGVSPAQDKCGLDRLFRALPELMVSTYGHIQKHIHHRSIFLEQHN